MLFRKKITRSCSYCKNATNLNGDTVLCIKKGVVSASKACRKFDYDPCKRVPPKMKPLDFSEYDEADFQL
jgi:hypothetical protein